jgi:UDP-N-acetylmuramate: L-alanyl-gamma-D-glutamyl-meso-diaminopimelate ligase
MRVHLTGVCGTGMGSLALLFREAGHDVSGSDVRFDPPMGDVLRAGGVTLLEGYEAGHFAGRPDLVVIGNAIRRDNVEAIAATDQKLPTVSMSGALREHFLKGRRPLVVCGTHGKTTTSAMCAWILSSAGQEPGYFIGGVTRNFPRSASNGAVRRKLASSRDATHEGSRSPTDSKGASGPVLPARAPFVVEGDEYDAVYWHKQSKFLDYVGVSDDDVAIVTSVEHDHIDIYPDAQAYEDAFRSLARAMPKGGLVVCDGHDPRAAASMQATSATVSYYALQGDILDDRPPHWLAAPAMVDDNGMQQFDLFAGGVSCGRFALPMTGMHNLRNATAAIAACAEGFGVTMAAARAALVAFAGVRRRQELLGEPDGVHVYDDFAHHPTAVDETLRALRARHPKGALWAIFEPRSATACRNVHQQAYVGAFGVADRVLLAPLGRTNVPEPERLDIQRLAVEIGGRAQAVASVEAMVDLVREGAEPGDTVAILSNGAFGGLHGRVLAALASRGPRGTR